MEIRHTDIAGLLTVEPRVHRDHRGFFQETFRLDALERAGVATEWVQDNHSRSGRGTLRGLHFQIGRGQAKLVRCARGSVLDVAVDVREGSPTFGHWRAFELDDRACRQLYVPIGLAHGFCVTSDVADVVYKCSSYYDAAAERTIAFDDPDLAIAWPDLEPIVSERDRAAPTLAQIRHEIHFDVVALA